MRDLIQRAEHIRGWAMVAMPKVFWLPCMTYPSGETRADESAADGTEIGETRREGQKHNGLRPMLKQRRNDVP